MKILIFYWKESLKQNETKEQRGGFLGTLVGTLGSILPGNLLSGKRIARAGYGKKWVAASSFKIFWNTKVLSERTKI